jgi:hypothetical protein
MRLGNKELNDIAKQAIEQGWTIIATNGNHIKWIAPTGKVTFSSYSPSDSRAIKNHVSIMRSMGFITIEKKKRRS